MSCCQALRRKVHRLRKRAREITLVICFTLLFIPILVAYASTVWTLIRYLAATGTAIFGSL